MARAKKNGTYLNVCIVWSKFKCSINAVNDA